MKRKKRLAAWAWLSELHSGDMIGGMLCLSMGFLIAFETAVVFVEIESIFHDLCEGQHFLLFDLYFSWNSEAIFA
jgi:hypothetical protein